MKKFLLFFLLISSIGFAQNLNDFKYAVVPFKFSFLKEDNQYNLNLLSKLFMEKSGFETYFDNDKTPIDFLENNCNKVYLDLIENNTVFQTKLKIVLKDCKGNILATSSEGISREKEYTVAYNQSLRMAFENFNILKSHKYQPSQKSMGMIGEPSIADKNLSENTKMKFEEKSVPLKAEIFEQGFRLYTQNTGKKFLVMTLYKTSLPDCYLFYEKEASGILIKKGEKYYIEIFIDGKFSSEEIYIDKF